MPVPSPAPRYRLACHLKDVLGFSDAEIDCAMDRGIVADKWSSSGKYIRGRPWANVKEECEMIGCDASSE